MTRAIVIERPEDVRVQLGDEIQNLRLNVVHVEPVRKPGPISCTSCFALSVVMAG
jgi:hypothetical protein